MHVTTQRPALFLLLALAPALLPAPGPVAGEAPPYPRAQLLVEPSELAASGDAAPFLVLDARGAEAHGEAHVPQARWVDSSAWAKAFGQGTDADGWSRRISALGITPTSRVVVYDDASLRDAARIWWILRYWGLEDVRLLNGAWKGWKTAGLPTEKGAVALPVAAPGAFAARARGERLATKKGLLEALGNSASRLQIIDSRSEAEHCGTEKFSNRRGGSIPGARHLDWVDLLEKETHRFKTAAELQQLFAAAGIDLARPTAAHCQSGGRASVTAFALELLGAKEVSNYHASWAEWGNADDTPVVPGTPRAARDPDLHLQGEYVGKLESDGKSSPIGVQVIARGKGRFEAVGHHGGLPGAGWDRSAKLRFKGHTNGSTTRLSNTGDGPVAALEISPLAGQPGNSNRMTALDARGKTLGTLERTVRTSPTLGQAAPAGAVVLFDGSTTENFRTAKGKPVTLTVDKLLRVEPGSGGLYSVPPQGKCLLHLEFRLPFEPAHEGQGRANSGCYLQGRYEVQILDSFGLEGRENECGGVYSSGKSPDQNLCLPPTTWQTYDIDFTPAAYTAEGKKTANARLTVTHNGVVIYRDLEIDHATTAAPKAEGPEPLPLYLQDHGHEVHFRNIWMVRG